MPDALITHAISTTRCSSAESADCSWRPPRRRRIAVGARLTLSAGMRILPRIEPCAFQVRQRQRLGVRTEALMRGSSASRLRSRSAPRFAAALVIATGILVTAQAARELETHDVTGWWIAIDEHFPGAVEARRQRCHGGTAEQQPGRARREPDD